MPEKIIEIWKDIPNFPYYQASNLGQIRSKDRKRSNGRFYKGKILACNGMLKGYRATNLVAENGKTKMVTVHRIIAITFLPNPFNLPQVNHLDGNRLNNKKDNLEWCTASQNGLHAYRLGLIKPQLGSVHGRSKLTEQQVKEIRHKATGQQGEMAKLGKEYGISRRMISFILARKNWTHI